MSDTPLTTIVTVTPGLDLTTVQGRLRYAREQREERVAGCAAALGFLPSVWTRWEEKGFIVAPIHIQPTLIKMCAAHLKCSEEWLRDGVGAPPVGNHYQNLAREQRSSREFQQLIEDTERFFGKPFGEIPDAED